MPSWGLFSALRSFFNPAEYLEQPLPQPIIQHDATMDGRPRSYLSRSNDERYEFEVDRWRGYDRLINRRYWGRVRAPPTNEHAFELALACQETTPTPQDLEDTILDIEYSNKKYTYDTLDVCLTQANRFRYKFPHTRHIVQRQRGDAVVEPYPMEDDEETSEIDGKDGHPTIFEDSDSSAGSMALKTKEGHSVRLEVDYWGDSKQEVNLRNWGVMKAPKTRKQALELALMLFTRQPSKDDMARMIEQIERGGKDYVCMTVDYLAEKNHIYDWFTFKYPETRHIFAIADDPYDSTAPPYPPKDDFSLRRPEDPGRVLSRNYAISSKWGAGAQAIIEPYEMLEIAIATLDDINDEDNDNEITSCRVHHNLRVLEDRIGAKRQVTKYLNKEYFRGDWRHVWVQQSLRTRFNEDREITDEWWLEALQMDDILRTRAEPKQQDNTTEKASLSKANLSLIIDSTSHQNPGSTATNASKVDNPAVDTVDAGRKKKKTGGKSKDKTEDMSEKGTAGRGLPMVANYRTKGELTTERTEEFWEDGPYVQRAMEGVFLPPMRHPCIMGTEMTVDNLPPFFVKLTDEQTGHILQFINQQNRAKHYVNIFWPAEFDATGKVRDRRVHAGPPYTGPAFDGTDALKQGGQSVELICQGPGWDAYGGRHFHSSGRPMTRPVIEDKVVPRIKPMEAPNTPTTAEFTSTTAEITTSNSSANRSTKRVRYASSPITSALLRQTSVPPQVDNKKDQEIARLKDELRINQGKLQQSLANQVTQAAIIEKLAELTETMAAARVWRQSIDINIDQRVDKAIEGLGLGHRSIKDVASGRMMLELREELQGMTKEVQDKEEIVGGE